TDAVLGGHERECAQLRELVLRADRDHERSVMLSAGKHGREEVTSLCELDQALEVVTACKPRLVRQDAGPPQVNILAGRLVPLEEIVRRLEEDVEQLPGRCIVTEGGIPQPIRQCLPA